MKKSLFLILTILVVLCVFCFVGCKKSDPTPEKTGLQTRVSTYQEAVYVGSDDSFDVSFVTGEAEKLIVIDGEVGEMAPFATLTVTPLAFALFNNTYTYLLKGESGERSGNLTKDVIGASFSADLENAKEIGKVQSVTIIAEGISENLVELTNKLDGALSWKEALAIAEKELAEAITAESDTGALPREIYVKLVNALSDADAPYYYYVSFIKSSSDYWALLLDPMTGEVISKKV